MSLWIEIHCDARKDGQNPSDRLRPRCRTNENLNVSALFKNGQGAPGLRYLKEKARKAGWVLDRKTGWICPGCQGPALEGTEG